MSSGSTWYWRDPARHLEAMRARFRDHVYAPHSHEGYSFGITDAGAQRFHCRGAAHTSSAGMVMAFNPDEVHDGRAAAELGYHYRIMHIGPAVVRDVLADAAGGRSTAPLPLFPQPVLTDPVLADAIGRLYAALSAGATPLALDERLTAAVTAMTRRGATRPPAIRTPTDRTQRQAAHRARALLHDAYLAPVPADHLARAAGCSRFALYRAFRTEFGLSPSDYQRQLRLRHARALLTAGTPAAEAAAASGFADQAHLGRWFQRVYGITPGTFARGANH